MFMVAASCVTTIMVLNYHHRLVDTHEMPDWVIMDAGIHLPMQDLLGSANLSAMDPLVPSYVQTWRKNYEKDNTNAEKDERPGQEGTEVQVPPGQCPGHG